MTGSNSNSHRIGNIFNGPTIPFWIEAIGALFLARIYTLSLSSFGWYHGFNEAVYTKIATEYNTDFWTPHRDSVPFFDTGPLTTYLIWASHSVLGVSEASSRLPVLMAYPLATWGAWRAAEGFWGEGKGKVAALLFASAPFVLLWFGRAQTDAWMTTGVLLFLAGWAKPEGKTGATLIVSGLVIGILSKQPALLLVPFAIILSVLQVKNSSGNIWMRGRNGFLVMIGTWFGCLWYGIQYLRFPDQYVSSMNFHSSERVGHLGENFPWVLVAMVLGSGATLFFCWLRNRTETTEFLRNRVTLLYFGLVGYGLFALFDSPIGHEYYALPFIGILTIYVARWRWTNILLVACVLINLVLAVGILYWAGDLGDRQVQEAGILAAALPEDAQITALDRLIPQLEFYSGREISKLGSENVTMESYQIVWDGSQVEEEARGPGSHCEWLTETKSKSLRPPLRIFHCKVEQMTWEIEEVTWT